jgi:hypothetical protein
MLVFFLSELLGLLCVLSFHVLSLIIGLGRIVESLRHAYLAEYGLTIGIG